MMIRVFCVALALVFCVTNTRGCCPMLAIDSSQSSVQAAVSCNSDCFKGVTMNGVNCGNWDKKIYDNLVNAFDKTVEIDGPLVLKNLDGCAHAVIFPTLVKIRGNVDIQNVPNNAKMLERLMEIIPREDENCASSITVKGLTKEETTIQGIITKAANIGTVNCFARTSTSTSTTSATTIDAESTKNPLDAGSANSIKGNKKSEDESGDEFLFSNWKWIAIGVGIIVVLAGVAFALFKCARKKKSNDKSLLPLTVKNVEGSKPSTFDSSVNTTASSATEVTKSSATGSAASSATAPTADSVMAKKDASARDTKSRKTLTIVKRVISSLKKSNEQGSLDPKHIISIHLELSSYINGGHIDCLVSELLELAEMAKETFRGEASMLRVSGRVFIIADIHGQYKDAVVELNYESVAGEPLPFVNNKFVFLGDYIDRGTHSLETITLLFALKVAFPQHFVLLRGNHETRNLMLKEKSRPFKSELQQRFSARDAAALYKAFNDAFDFMPLTALVGGRILCMHGGISEHIESLEDLLEIERPIKHVSGDDSLVNDILWADPMDREDDDYYAPEVLFKENAQRNTSYKFNRDAILRLCMKLKIDLIIRGHQAIETGFKFYCNGRLLSIFSAPCYTNSKENIACCVQVEADATINTVRYRARKEEVHNEDCVTVKEYEKKPSKFRMLSKFGMFGSATALIFLVYVCSQGQLDGLSVSNVTEHVISLVRRSATIPAIECCPKVALDRSKTSVYAAANCKSKCFKGVEMNDVNCKSLDFNDRESLRAAFLTTVNIAGSLILKNLNQCAEVVTFELLQTVQGNITVDNVSVLETMFENLQEIVPSEEVCRVETTVRNLGLYEAKVRQKIDQAIIAGESSCKQRTTTSTMTTTTTAQSMTTRLVSIASNVIGNNGEASDGSKSSFFSKWKWTITGCLVVASIFAVGCAAFYIHRKRKNTGQKKSLDSSHDSNSSIPSAIVTSSQSSNLGSRTTATESDSRSRPNTQQRKAKSAEHENLSPIEKYCLGPRAKPKKYKEGRKLPTEEEIDRMTEVELLICRDMYWYYPGGIREIIKSAIYKLDTEYERNHTEKVQQGVYLTSSVPLTKLDPEVELVLDDGSVFDKVVYNPSANIICEVGMRDLQCSEKKDDKKQPPGNKNPAPSTDKQPTKAAPTNALRHDSRAAEPRKSKMKNPTGSNAENIKKSSSNEDSDAEGLKTAIDDERAEEKLGEAKVEEANVEGAKVEAGLLNKESDDENLKTAEDWSKKSSKSKKSNKSKDRK